MLLAFGWDSAYFCIKFSSRLMHSAKETGFFTESLVTTKYLRKNPVSEPPCVIPMANSRLRIRLQ
jgi:hypothetical protein